MEKTMIVKTMVAAINGNGEADFYFVKVKCTEDQYDSGCHFDAAEIAAQDNGYEPKLTFDENEVAGKAISDKFVWDSANIVEAK